MHAEILNNIFSDTNDVLPSEICLIYDSSCGHSATNRQQLVWMPSWVEGLTRVSKSFSVMIGPPIQARIELIVRTPMSLPFDLRRRQYLQTQESRGGKMVEQAERYIWQYLAELPWVTLPEHLTK